MVIPFDTCKLTEVLNRNCVKSLPEQFVLRRLKKKGELPNEDTFFKSVPPPTKEEATATEEAGEEEIPSGDGEKEVSPVKKKERCVTN